MMKKIFQTPQIQAMMISKNFYCRHSILHPWFNQGEWLEWPFIYPKNHDCITCINLFLHYIHQFVFALHASVHSLHILKMILRF